MNEVIKAAFAAEILNATDAVALASLLDALPAGGEDALAAEIGQKRTALGVVDASTLTDSELIAEVSNREAVKAHFTPQDVAAPSFEVVDGVAKIGDFEFAATEIAADANLTTGFAIVPQDELATLRTNAVTDEVLESLRGLAASVGADSAETMDFDAVVVYLAGQTDTLKSRPATTEVTEDASLPNGYDELADYISGHTFLR